MAVCSPVCVCVCGLVHALGQNRREIVNARPRRDRNDTPLCKLDNIRIFSVLNERTRYRKFNKNDLTLKGEGATVGVMVRLPNVMVG